MVEEGDVKDIQIKIKQKIEELEEKVKNSKIYWNNNDLNFDQHFIQNFIDSHYNEIVNHLNQIKHHLEKINHHKKEIDDIQLCLTHDSNSSSPESPHDINGDIDDKTVKRPEEDKVRFKSRRLARTTSLKYVLQWEKMLDEHKEENSIHSVKRRTKNGKSDQPESEVIDVSKIMVKSRVLQFEGIQKPKRISSTYDTFLDFSGEKPKRIKSFPILEELDDEVEQERPRSCELSLNSTNEFGNLDEPVKSNFEELNANELPSRDSECSEKEEAESLRESKPTEEISATTNLEQIHETNPALGEKGEVEKSPRKDDIPMENLTITNEDTRRPRIVEVHFKQASVPAVNPEVPSV